MKHINKLIVLAFVALTIGCSQQAQQVQVLDPVSVKVEKAVFRSEGVTISSSGRIEARNSANVSTRFMGHVTELKVQVGDKVVKGQQLVNISNSDLLAKKSQVEATILQAESALMNARKDYDRFNNLFEKGSASEKELDDMTTRYEIAKANLQAAQQMKEEVKAQMIYTNIVSPFNGIVINTFVKEGDMANPGMPLVSVEGRSGFQVSTLISESDIAKLDPDVKTRVLVKTLNKEFDGKIIEMSPSAKNTGGQYTVKIDLLDESEEVKPGMFVNVRFQSKSINNRNDLVLIDSRSLVSHGQLIGVYALGNDDTAILRWLRLGETYGDYVEVLSGIQPEETYIVDTDGRLFNGAKVTYESLLSIR